MGAGRPPDGLKHVDRLEGDETLKQRLRVVLETLSGERTIVDACGELRISHTRFHELRQQVLEGALAALSFGSPGRPLRPDAPELHEQEALRTENLELRRELQATRVRTEIALAVPHLLTKQARMEIKKNARAAKKASRRETAAVGNDT